MNFPDPFGFELFNWWIPIIGSRNVHLEHYLMAANKIAAAAIITTQTQFPTVIS